MEKWKKNLHKIGKVICKCGVYDDGGCPPMKVVEAFVEKVRQDAIREVIDTLESEPRMTSSQMVRHVRAKFL